MLNKNLDGVDLFQRDKSDPILGLSVKAMAATQIISKKAGYN